MNRIVFLSLLMLTVPFVSLAEEPASAPVPAGSPLGGHPRQVTPFDRGQMRLSFGAGGGVYDGASFIALAAGASYFVWPGVELGLDVTQWFGSSPNVTQLSPHLRYVFYQLRRVSPYVGTFYRHWFFWEGSRDFDTLGARLGVLWALGRNAFAGLGGAFERVVSECEAGCWAVYPEVSLGLVF